MKLEPCGKCGCVVDFDQLEKIDIVNTDTKLEIGQVLEDYDRDTWICPACKQYTDTKNRRD